MSDYKTITRDGVTRPEHIVVAETAAGRPLKENEVVHHINGDKSDNRPENLVIMDRAEHTRLHSVGNVPRPETIDKQRRVHTGKSNKTHRVLSDDQVVDIVNMLASGSTIRSLAEKYAVSNNVIIGIRDGRTYRDVLDKLPQELLASIPAKKPHKASETNRGLSIREVSEIRIRASRGESEYSIAKKYSVSHSVISKLLKGETYTDIPLPVVVAKYRELHDARDIADILLSYEVPRTANPDDIASLGELLMERYRLLPTREAIILFRLLLRAASGSAEDIMLIYAISSYNYKIDDAISEGSQLSVLSSEK